MTYEAEVTADSPLLYYKFDNNLTNAGSVVPTATFTPVAMTYATAQQGSALSFNGTTQYVRVDTTNAMFNDKTWTVEAWIKMPVSMPTPNDYQDIMRRLKSGCAILLRVRGTSIATPGKLETYVSGVNADGTGNGSAASFSSTTALNDNQWHHVVLTSDGTTLRQYIDGVLDGSGTYPVGLTLADTPIYIAANETLDTSKFQGQIDEWVVYGTALTATRVTAHYTAGLPVSTTGAWTTATGRVSAPNAYVPNTAGSWTTATSTAKAPNARGFDSVKITTGIDGTNGATSTTSMTVGGTTVVNGVSKPNYGYTKFDLPAILTGSYIKSARLKMRRTAGGTTGDSTVDVNQKAAASTTDNSILRTVKVTSVTAETYFDLGIETIVQSWADGSTNYGLLLSQPVGNTVYLNTFESTLYFPSLEIVYDPPLIIPWETGTGTARSIQPAINTAGQFLTATARVLAPEAGSTVSWSGQLLTGTGRASAPLATGSATTNPNVYAPWDTTNARGSAPDALYIGPAIGQWLTATGRTLAILMTATAQLNVAETWVSTRTRAKFVATVQQNADDDPLRQAILSTVRYTDTWFRLDETAGNILTPVRIGPETTYTQTFNLVGSYNFGVEGPESRAAIHMTNGYAEKPLKDIADYSIQFSSEFIFRTSKQDGILSYGIEANANPFGYLGANLGSYIIGIKAGKVTVSRYYAQSSDKAYMFSSFASVADGNWHHVTVQQTYFGLDIFIDGKLDMHRWSYNSGGGANVINNGGFRTAVGAPDYYFGGPPELALPNFEGDVMEMIYRQGGHVDTLRIHRNIYNAVRGVVPGVWETANVNAVAPKATGKANRPRALVVSFGGRPDYRTEQLQDIENDFYQSGFNQAYPGDYDFGPEGGIGYQYDGTSIWAGYQLFYVWAAGDYQTYNAGYPYRDPVTDKPRFINFQTDYEFDDIDMILIRNYPDEGYERDKFFQLANFGDPALSRFEIDVRFEEFVKSLRKVVDSGVNLFCTNPTLAIELGIVERTEFIPYLLELNPQTGYRREYEGADERARDIDPWNGINPQTGRKTFGVEFYMDSHAVTKFRLQKEIPGLTDLGGYILTEKILWEQHDEWKLNGFTMRHTHRPDGIEVGDEFYFRGPYQGRAEPSDNQKAWGIFLRYYGTWAYPPGSVKAGTVVTTFNQKHWVGNQEVLNPYRDYATTIVVRPGDLLNGTPCGGKIFLHSSESVMSTAEPRPVIQQLPPIPPYPISTPQIIDGIQYESEEQRSYQWSEHRLVMSGTAAAKLDQYAGDSVNIDLPVGPAGDEVRKVLAKLAAADAVKGSGAVLFAVKISNLYPTKLLGYELSMYLRGLFWLQPDEAQVPINPGAVRITTAVSSARGTEWTVTTGKSVVADWGVARANVYATDSSVTRGFWTLATALAKMPPTTESILFATATAKTAGVNPNVFIDYLVGDHIDLYYEHVKLATVFLKEEI